MGRQLVKGCDDLRKSASVGAGRQELMAVITPTWTGLSTHINAGGLRNSHHYPRRPSAPESSGPWVVFRGLMGCAKFKGLRADASCDMTWGMDRFAA